jgi:hypothetical protein
VQKSILLAAIQKEIQRHDFSYFVDDPPSVAEGGKGPSPARVSTGRSASSRLSVHAVLLREAFSAMEPVVMMHIGATIGYERSQHALKVQSG